MKSELEFSGGDFNRGIGLTVTLNIVLCPSVFTESGTTAGVALLEGGGIFLAALLHQQLTVACLSLSLSVSVSFSPSVSVSLSLALSPFRLLQRSTRRTMIAPPVVTTLGLPSELITRFSFHVSKLT